MTCGLRRCSRFVLLPLPLLLLCITIYNKLQVSRSGSWSFHRCFGSGYTPVFDKKFLFQLFACFFCGPVGILHGVFG